MSAPELTRTPEEAGHFLARWCHGLPEPLFLEALACVAGEIEGALIKAGNDRSIAVRLAGTVQLSACQEWQRLRAFSTTVGGHA
jgi:hypothetical protein